MKKQYVRTQATLAKGGQHTFTCIKCGQKFHHKPEFKQHWRETADHDDRKLA